MLVSPPELKVQARGLDRDSPTSDDNLMRYIGPRMEPDRLIKLVLGGEAVVEEGQEIFDQPAPEKEADTAVDENSSSSNTTAQRLVPIALLAAVLLVIWVVVRKLRSAD